MAVNGRITLRVAYDLRTLGRDYIGFYQALNASGDVVVLYSDAWVATTLTLEDVTARPRRAVDASDRLAITDFGSRIRYQNVGSDAEAWLMRQNLLWHAT